MARPLGVSWYDKFSRTSALEVRATLTPSQCRTTVRRCPPDARSLPGCAHDRVVWCHPMARRQAVGSRPERHAADSRTVWSSRDVVRRRWALPDHNRGTRTRTGGESAVACGGRCRRNARSLRRRSPASTHGARSATRSTSAVDRCGAPARCLRALGRIVRRPVEWLIRTGDRRPPTRWRTSRT